MVDAAGPVTVSACDRVTALIALRPGRENEFASALAGMGAALPAMGRFGGDGLILARLAPGQVLAMRDGTEAGLMDELAPLRDGAGLIDLSDARSAVRVSGPGAVAYLERRLPIDLHEDRLIVGACAQTMMAHLAVLVLRHGRDVFELQCGRSFEWSFRRALGMTEAA